MILKIVEDLTEFMKPFKDFIYKDYTNPFMWLGLFVIGLAVFGIVYKALQKEK